MEEEERIRILELAYELVEPKIPKSADSITKVKIEAWATLFDQAYKAIMKTALGK